MGSFATSMHVHHDDHRQVAAAVQELLLEAGFISTERLPGPDEWGLPGMTRGILVSEAQDRWVSLLDSDLMGIDSVASALSEHFDTHAMTVSVNDSASWQMMLFEGGEFIDAFDTFTDEELYAQFGDEVGGELQALIESGDEDAAGEKLQDLLGEMQQRMESALPEDIRQIHERLEAGEATEEEERRFQQWTQNNMEDTMDNVMGVLTEMMPGLAASARGEQPDIGEPTERPPVDIDEEELAEHIKHLGPLLAPGVGEDELAEVLTTRSAFAEDDLEGFLTLLGISPGWAYLAYPYIFEFDDEELAEVGVYISTSLGFIDAATEQGPNLRLV